MNVMPAGSSPVGGNPSYVSGATASFTHLPMESWTQRLDSPIGQRFLQAISDLLGQPLSSAPPPLQQEEFLEKYQVRLETKLEQKSVQIARAERLLQTVSAHEKPGFEASLNQALAERQSIEVELARVNEILQRRNLQQ